MPSPQDAFRPAYGGGLRDGPKAAVPELGPGLYGQWCGAEIALITERLERALILELAGDVPGRDVLDVGCGNGDLALDLWWRGARVSGVDLSPEMIEAAREQAPQQASTSPSP